MRDVLLELVPMITAVVLATVFYYIVMRNNDKHP